MKKLLFLLAIGMFLSLPYTAFATLLGSGQLYVEWSYALYLWGGLSPSYYTDYDGKVASSGFDYTTGLEEIFCVSEDHANGIESVDFYTITSDLDNIFGDGFYEQLSEQPGLQITGQPLLAGYDPDDCKR